MRSASALVAAALLGCGPPAEATSPPPPAPVTLHWQPILATPQVELAVRREPARRGDETGLVMRITRHDDPEAVLRGDGPILVDLRDRGRVIGPDAPAGVRLPLSAAQIAELQESSALSTLEDEIAYAVPVALPACTGERTVSLGGVLTMLDGERAIELVGDGAALTLPCDAAPLPLDAATAWVSGTAPLTGEARDPADLASDLPPLLHGASIGSASDVALLPFSYDARPIERFRYDACVAAGRCPARSTPQPPGSLRAPAVGMSWEAADAFCTTRGLHVASPEQQAAIGEAPRAILEGDALSTVLGGFRCVEIETSATPSP